MFIKSLKPVLFILVLFASCFQAEATHLMGSDIFYKYLGNSKYEVTIKVYRDCTGVPFNSLYGTVRCGSETQRITYTKTTVKDITPLCKTDSSACSKQTRVGIGVEEHIFLDTIDLGSAPYKSWIDSGCCKFYISYAQCCRNQEITTGFASQIFYSDAMLNVCNLSKTNAKGNNSPILHNKPIMFACCSTPSWYNSGALDTADRDSLSFELVSPQGGYNSDLKHVSPFDAEHPMTSYCPSGGVTCTPKPNATPPRGFYMNPAYGDIVFTPTKCDEVAIIVLKVYDWRRDSTGKYILMGYTKRDMQVIVQNCSKNDPPRISGVQSHTICEGDSLTFTIKSTDAPPPSNPNGRKDTTALTWIEYMPGATFRIKDTTAREKELIVSWQTKLGDANEIPYGFLVTAEDDNCPIKGRSARQFSVRVLPKAIAKPTVTVLNCGKIKVTSQVLSDSNISVTHQWKVYERDSISPIDSSSSQIDSFTFSKPGYFRVEYTVSNKYNCLSTYLDTVFITQSIKPNLGNDTSTNDTSSILLNASSGYKSYLWSDNSTDSTLKVDGKVLGKGAYTYWVEATDSNNCKGRDTIVVTVAGTNSLFDINNRKLEVYPSPTSDFLNVELPANFKKGELKVFSSQGQMVLKKSLKSASGEKFRLDMKNLPSGVYLVELDSKLGTHTSKVVKK